MQVDGGACSHICTSVRYPMRKGGNWHVMIASNGLFDAFCALRARFPACRRQGMFISSPYGTPLTRSGSREATNPGSGRHAPRIDHTKTTYPIPAQRTPISRPMHPISASFPEKCELPLNSETSAGMPRGQAPNVGQYGTDF